MFRNLLKKNRTVRMNLTVVLLILFLAVSLFFGAGTKKAIAADKLTNGDFQLEMVSSQVDFSAKDLPEMEFKFSKNKRIFSDFKAWLMSIFIDEYKDIDISVSLMDARENEVYSDVSNVSYIKDGRFQVKIPQMSDMGPGKYKVIIEINDNGVTEGQIIKFSQDFTWGVLAFNLNKSVYLPGETAYLQMGVLDDLGSTICNADIFLEITAPDGGTAYLNTDNGLVARNNKCGTDNIINSPDYFAYYGLAGAGIYRVKITANTKNGAREIYEQFEVRDSLPFEIERIGPTRINPVSGYEMKIKIKANEEFQGEITEIIPEEFSIFNFKFSNNFQFSNYQINENERDKILLIDKVFLKSGVSYELSYNFDAPDVSPEFYLLGPLETRSLRFSEENRSDLVSFTEARQWQIASDAVATSTYEFTTNGYSIGWDLAGTLPANAWDQSNDTYAGRDIPKKTGGGEPANYIRTFTNNVADIGNTISQVYIGIEGKCEVTTDVTAYLRPIYGGTATGSEFNIPGTELGIADSVNTIYREITNDGLAPSPWAWDDIINLDVMAYGGNTNNGQSRELQIDQFRIMVVYEISNAPTSMVSAANFRTDGSGVVDLSIKVSDVDLDTQVRAKLEYATGTTCIFSPSGDPTLDETDTSATSSSSVDAKIANINEYQIGNALGWITAAEGENTVSFDWLSQSDIATSGTYCLQLTAYDGISIQSSPATTTVYIDNYPPQISDVIFTPSSDYLKIGDTATATIQSDGINYTAGAITINGVDASSTLIDNGDNTYSVSYTVTEGDDYIDDANNLPVSITLKDIYNNSSSAYNQSDPSGRPGVDADKPSISQVIINNGVYKVGDDIIVTVYSDEIGYSLGSTTINNVEMGVPDFTDLGNNNYRLTYNVSEGDTSTSSGNIEISIVLADDAGNKNDAYITPEINTASVDASSPTIISVTIPNAPMKVGDIVIATTTVGDDLGDTYGLISGTINGFTLDSFTPVNSTTYTAEFTVAEAGADVLAGSDISVSLIIDDTAGNQSTEYNTAISQANDPIDANTPTIATVSFNPSLGTLKVGDTATATIHAAQDETGLNASSTMTINNVEVYGTFFELSGGDYIVTYTVSEYDTDIDDDTEDLPINLSLVDDAGNISAASTAPDIAGRPGVDAHMPTNPGPLSFVSHNNTSITLHLGATTTETNFSEYKIFYKIDIPGVTESDYLHSSSTDENLGNKFFNSATTTTIYNLATGTDYYFNIYAYDKAGNKASSTQELAASTNYAPGTAGSLGQYKNNGITSIINNGWTNENNIKLSASATDPDTSEILILYFEAATSSDSFIGDYSSPCSYDAGWNACNSKVWAITSSPGDYSQSPFTATVTPQLLFNSSVGYKWRVLACDDDGACSTWVNAGTDPNFMVDYTPPTAPGNLEEYSKTAISVTLKLGSTTTEANFSEYKIFYKPGSSGVTELNNLHGSSSDENLADINYLGATTTIIIDLAANNQYVFNIWAYDKAGNKASATEMVVTTAGASNPPTGTFGPVSQKRDGTGAVDISITVDDPDNDDTLRARINYATGTDCVFSSGLEATIDSGNVTDSYGTPPDIDNDNNFQIGTTSGWIRTSPGANTVNFDWLSKTDEPLADGYYCLQLTANDGLFSQNPPATTTVYIDNTPPTPPGSLGEYSKSTYSATLLFGATSTETNFSEYKIFYKIYDGSAPTESDYALASSTDFNLGNKFYNTATTTTINGLLAGTQYSFSIWAYDSYSNVSSSSAVSVTTNHLPNNPASLEQLKNDAITPIPNNTWTTQDNVKLKASALDSDSSEIISLYFEIRLNNDDFTIATTVPFGACASSTDWESCGSKIWQVTSSVGDYSASPFEGTVNPNSIYSSTIGYKWQAIACDDDGVCSEWSQFNGIIPNYKVDYVPPTPPGSLSVVNYTSNSATLAFGASTTEDNFLEYKIFYSTSTPVTEIGYEHSSSTDSSLGFKNYFSATSTIINGLESGEIYYFNIFAYDEAGNISSSTQEASTTINIKPNGSFLSAVNRRDGSGVIDISVLASDANFDNARALIEYEAGGGCGFDSATKATISEIDASATSTYGDAKVENDYDYQIGNASGWIITSSGSNTVSFDWLSDSDLPNEEGIYCLRLTVNDQIENQVISATTTISIDNIAPSTPGNLSFYEKASDSITLSFGATSTETNFSEYIIYYDDNIIVDENDWRHSSTTDINLADKYLNEATTTIIEDLNPDTQYSFKIYAYDLYGNKSSSGITTEKTNSPPTGSFNLGDTGLRTDGTGILDISIEVYDTDHDVCQAKIEYTTGTECIFTESGNPTLDETDENIEADYYDPGILNSSEYQVGIPGAYIITASGTNSVEFDWDTKSDIINASGYYCLKLTVKDSVGDISSIATTTLIIDNVQPTIPGDLSVIEASSFNVVLGFNTPTIDTYFKEYKIFYKANSPGVTELDFQWNQNDDGNLASSTYGGVASTTVTDLAQNTLYFFNIFVYDNYGNIASATSEISTSTTIVPSATWREEEDDPDPTGGNYIGKEESIRLRISLANAGDWEALNYQYRLEYGEKNGNCTTVDPWTVVPITNSTEHFVMVNSDYFDHGASTTNKFDNLELYTWTPGYMIENPYNISGPQLLASGEYTEIEYAIQATATSTAGATYCFRATNNGTEIDNYDKYPELTLAPPPIGLFNSAVQQTDGQVGISIDVNDPGKENCRVRMDYVLGSDCNFSPPGDPSISTEGVSDSHGNVPIIDNSFAYQIGTTSSMIVTQYGTTTVSFNWDAATDLPGADDIYCLQLTANDGYDDQTLPATTTIVIDYAAPSEPGDLYEITKTTNSVTLGFGATSSDSNFYEYKIFYKEGTSGVTENNMMWASSSDSNLGFKDFLGATTTTIDVGLEENKQYVFKIWAYDKYGNKSYSFGETLVKLVPTISGIVYSDEGVNLLLTGPSVSIVVNGVVQDTVSASVIDGSFLFDSINPPATGTPIMVYLDNSTEKGVTYSRYGGIGQVTNFNIYQNKIIVRHEDAGPITLSDIGVFDNGYDPLDIKCSVSDGSLSVESGQELYIWSGTTFDPGAGNISVDNVEINGEFMATGGQIINVSGNWDATGGVFISATSTVEFTSNNTGNIIKTNGSPFYSLVFNGSGGEWTFLGNATTTATTTISAGTLIHGGDNNFQTGSLVIADGAYFTKATGTGILIFEDLGEGIFEDSNPTPNNLGNVQIGYSPAVTRLNSDFVADSLTINSGDKFYARGFEVDITNFITVNGTYDCLNDKESDGTITTLGTDWTVGPGAEFIASNSTTTFDGISASVLNSGGVDSNHDFYNLSFNKSSLATTTITAYDIKISNDLIIGANSVLDVSSSNFDIYSGGDWLNSGVFIARQATTTFDSLDSVNRIDPGSSSFYNAYFNSASGGWNIINHATSTNDLELINISSFTVNSGISIGVQGEYSIYDSAPNNTSWNSNSTLFLNSGSTYEVGSKNQALETYGLLKIGADTDISLWNSTSTSYDINSTGSLYSMDHNSANGSLYIWGDYYITATTSYWSYSTDFDGSPGANRQVNVYLAPNATTTLDGGILNIIGSTSASTTIASQGAGTYALFISSGELNANYYKIRGINESGLNLSGSPTITSLDNGDFELEINGGRMITVASSVIGIHPQMVITGCLLATSTGVGSGYNVYLSGVPTSYWAFTAHYGGYDGESFDYDSGDPRGYIIWDDSPDYMPKSQNWRWYHKEDMETPSATSSVAAENTAPSGIGPNNTLKLRLTINETAGLSGVNVKMRLEYSSYSDFSADVHFVGEIGSTTADWDYADGAGIDNALISSTTLSDSSAFATHNESGISASTYTHATNTPAEWEFTIYNNNATTTSVYYFRAYANYYNAQLEYNYPVLINTGESYPSLLVSSSSLSFIVSGLPASTITEGITTDFTTTATSVPFTNLSFDVETEGAHRFTITTNAESGYQLFVNQKQDLISNGGASIDPIIADNSNPAVWSINPNPSGFGYHTGDDTLSGLAPSRFAPDYTYARFENTIKEIGYSQIPVEEEVTDFVYKIEVTNQQEAGDYETEIVYILVPTY